MAGDWIPFDHDFPEKPEVLAIFAATRTPIGEIMLRMHKFWRLVDRQTTDGHLYGVDVPALAHVCGGDEEFWTAVHSQGWLGVAEDGHVFMPRFDDRFSKPTRARMLDARLKRASRRAAGALHDPDPDPPPDGNRAETGRAAGRQPDASPTDSRQASGQEPDADPTEAGRTAGHEPDGSPTPIRTPRVRARATATAIAITKDQEPETTGVDAAAQHMSAATSLAALSAAWNAIPGVERCEKLTDKRKTAFRQRTRDAYWREHVDAALARVAASRFCRGAGKQGWVAHIDWFLRPDTVVQIIEGKFDDPPRGGRSPPGLSDREARSLEATRLWLEEETCTKPTDPDWRCA